MLRSCGAVHGWGGCVSHCEPVVMRVVLRLFGYGEEVRWVCGSSDLPWLEGVLSGGVGIILLWSFCCGNGMRYEFWRAELVYLYTVLPLFQFLQIYKDLILRLHEIRQ